MSRRVISTEPTISLYRNHDRELMFHGTAEEARAAGIGIRTKCQPWIVRIGNKHYRVVNQGAYGGGSIGLWLSSQLPESEVPPK